jgi:hypothetical protein
MKDRRYSPDKYLESFYEHFYRSPYENAKSADDYLKASEKVREGLRKVLNMGEIPGKIEHLKPVILESADRGSYTIETLSVELCKGWNTLCYLLISKKPNGNGVVAICGHGYGARQIVRLGKKGRYRAINFLHNYQKNFAVELAERGNTVIAYEPIGFGEARLDKDAWIPFYGNSCDTISHHSLMYGFTTASLRVYQAIRCADILESKGIKDLGCMGISGGGLVSLYLACVDDRIKKAVVSGYTNTFRDSVLSMWHCPDNYIPGIIRVGEIYDLASSIAPRKLLIETGFRDPIFPKIGVDKAIDNISKVYDSIGAKNNFIVDRFDGKHQISGKISFDYFTEEKN